ncbi:hypothetical protein Despr_1056 [Candidatus Moduliflexus flocculans]|uniref:PEP-CTERM protein-sorting domain-containing protein n=1 Tax=Candidatus Moduliflexus flocculans TaxID=1499966 RepID=A0A0S6VYI0_9BACT|nr:hypothetical protein Despr_1056 [Candidatus Moduliflexus flocculans]
MKKFLVILAVSVLSCGLAGSAMALSFGDSSDGKSLQQVFNEFTVGGNSSVNTLKDYLEYDEFWKQTASMQSAVTMVVEIAGFKDTNVFGIYDAANSNNRVELFSGIASPGIANGGMAVFTILDNGDVYVNYQKVATTFSGAMFGFYLDSSARNGGGLFFSDTSLNQDGFDHMAAYQGLDKDMVRLNSNAPANGLLWTSNEYILAWEDLYGGGDSDYQDFVAMVESVDPAVPEPSTVLLLGAGVLGMVAFGRKYVKK